MTLDDAVRPDDDVPHGNNGTESIARRCRPASHQDLGLAILVVENASGAYEPVGVVMSMREALEMNMADYQARMRALENGGDPLFPDYYVLWARDQDGTYRTLRRIDMEDYHGTHD